MIQRASFAGLLGAASLAFALLGACESQTAPAPSPPSSEPPKAPAAKPPEPAPAATAVAPAPAVDLEKLPAEEDFEEEASTSITPKNLESKLNELEKEMQGD